MTYTFNGAKYEAVVGNTLPFSVDYPVRRECRVNPARPWEVERSWGWRPGLVVALFPVPFLVAGVAGLAFISIPPLRRSLEVTGSSSRWSNVVAAGVGFGFVGSIVGLFVGLCGEMWMADEPVKWFLTVFLIPFVGWVATLAWRFLDSIRLALQA
jgi:hypothetical protein